MKRLSLSSLILLILLTATGCTTSVTRLNTSGPYTYKINAVGISKDIQEETISKANHICRTLNKDYKFIRNTILPKPVMGMNLVSYDLVFCCVEPGSADTPAPAGPAEAAPADITGATPLPETGESQAAPEHDGAKEEKLAAAGASKDKKRPTGDTPGEPESLGDPPGKGLELTKEEGDIIEEKIIE